jgi:mannose-1-phosphate guanylyltransferase
MIVPVILAGGSGTRLWPLSRELYPKQLINLYNEHTLLQNTIMRIQSIEGLNSPIIVCNESHRFMTAEQLRQINVSPAAIILEPIGKNTAPAIALAALAALKDTKDDKDPILLVLPADHVIQQISEFHKLILTGCKYAEKENLITFGIIPDSPEIGYGYIKKGKILETLSGAAEIEKFVEKPDFETASQYVESGLYCWNSGMFIFKASTIIKEFEKHASKILESCRQSFTSGFGDLDFFRMDKKLFELIPSDSIDYAVMEKTDKGIVIPFAGGWSDLGSFDTLWKTGKKDENNNVTKGDICLYDVKHSYISSESRLVAAVGTDNFVIIETRDAILICPRHRVQDIKKIVEQLKNNNRNEPVTHSKVYRPWGSYESIDLEKRFQVKRITVKPGSKLSLQKHFHRAEHWTVVSGTAIITRGEEQMLLKEDESAYIPIGTLHRLENPGKIPLELIEIQSGSYLDEDDIVRYEDDYGRN